jgi:SGNH domain (fused to AT3 domains)
MRILGKASYSIYLVHWPILIFTGYFYPLGRPGFISVLCLLASLALGILSWRIVETPFREPGGISSRAKYTSAFASVAAMLLIGIAVITSSGFPGRFSTHVASLAWAAEERGRFDSCLGNAIPKTGIDGLCRIGAPDEEPSFLVWGDSLAVALLEGLDRTASSAGIAGVYIGTDACPPLLGFDGLFQPSWARCRTIQRHMPKLLTSHAFDTVLLAGSWIGYDRRDPTLFASTMDATFSMMRNLVSDVIVFGVIPPARANVPATMAKEEAFGISAKVASGNNELRVMADLDGRIERSARSHAIRFIDVKKYLCDPACRTQIDGKPLYFDNLHFSPFGSLTLVQNILTAERIQLGKRH